MTKQDFLELSTQKEKELFNPIISGSCDNANLLENLSAAFIDSMQRIQRKEGGIDRKSITTLVAGMLTSWELKDVIKEELM